MDEGTPKEKILARIREAIVESKEIYNVVPDVDLEESVFPDLGEQIDFVFAENFVANGGKFIYCNGVQETVDSVRLFAQQNEWNNIFCSEKIIQRILTHAGLTYSEDPKELILQTVGFSSCQYLLARTGSVMYSSAESGRRMYANVESLVFVATTDQLAADMKTAYKLMKEKYKGKMPSMVNTMTGFSRFLDVDGEQAPGFGPKNVFLFLVETQV